MGSGRSYNFERTLYFFLKMVKRCIAAGCSNIAQENVSLFSFLRDPVLRDRWTKQVRRTHDGWSGPTPYSFVCSDHFTEDCFETDTFMAQKLGIKKRKILKSDAVSTIFPRVLQPSAPPPSKKRTASAIPSEPGYSQAA